MENKQVSDNREMWAMGIPKSERKYYIPAIIGVVLLCISFFFEAVRTDTGRLAVDGFMVLLMAYIMGYLNYRGIRIAWREKRVDLRSVCISMIMSGVLIGIFLAQFILAF